MRYLTTRSQNMEIDYILFFVVLSCLGWNECVINSRYYPRYHLAPIKGWMKYPSGFCVFKGEYHLFYQYNPYSSLEPGIAHWGHAKSQDLFHWINLPIAMKPDKTYDSQGVFSGSAVVENNVMHIFYTGNVNHRGQNPNHTQVQALAMSTDGVTVKKDESNPIIEGVDYQPDIRDPKVWKHGDDWYMVLGHSSNNGTQGRALLFKSSNIYNWNFVSVLAKSNGSLGYMWECPDFFELDGHFVLLFSTQGVREQGNRFKNLYQNGFIIGKFNYTSNLFTAESEFTELDSGHDFYATQTVLVDSGRRLLVAWMDMSERKYPEGNDGFTGQLTIVRQLSLTKDKRLIQVPVEEINSIRQKLLFSGNCQGGCEVALENKAGEVFLVAPTTKNLTLYIESNNAADKVTIEYDSMNGQVSLNRGGEDGLRRMEYNPVMNVTLRVFIDASSIELFFGMGDITFSSRFFSEGPLKVRLADNCIADSFIVYNLNSTLYINH